MNGTGTDEQDDTSPVMLYMLMVETGVNIIISIFTTWRLGHLNFKIDKVKCLGVECSGIDIETSDSGSK